MESERSSGVHRTLAILSALGTQEATERGGLGVVEIARLVGREKSQVSRALKALDRAGFVERDRDDLGYRLGWQMFALAANAGRPRLLTEAPRVLRRLVSVLKERVHLTVRTTEGALTVISESPMRAVQTAGWVGRVTPLDTTSSGRALLFDHTDDDVRELFAGIPLTAGGPQAPRDVEDLIDRLRRAREAGYALAVDEFEAGLVAAAAPVRDFQGRVMAAVNVSAPKYRMGRELEPAARVVATAAGQISRAMAGR